MTLIRARTTIGLKLTTKNRLDRNRAPGQCYNGFLCQLMDLWEEINGGVDLAGISFEHRKGGVKGTSKYLIRKLNGPK